MAEDITYIFLGMVLFGFIMFLVKLLYGILVHCLADSIIDEWLEYPYTHSEKLIELKNKIKEMET